MRTDFYTKAVLTVIAVLLGVLAFRSPMGVQAQNSNYDLYIEPGYTTIRKPDNSMQVPGKVMIDRSNGDVWGFPTLSGGEYPSDPTSTAPAVSKPFYLGKFDFPAMKK